jgi:hypothetical protein
MPILEQGYEPYRGALRAGNLRNLSIAGTALRRNLRWWIWLLLAMSLLFGSGKEYVLLLVGYIPTVLFDVDPADVDPFLSAFVNHPRLYTDMMATQAFWALVMGITVGAGEVAEDLRTGALVFYLGRPVTRRDYVLGKVLAVSAAIAAVTLVPLLVLFCLQALFEGTSSWLREHLYVLPAALLFTALECVFVSGLVLGTSALATRRLRATVSLAGVLLALFVTSAILAPPFEWTAHEEQRQVRRAIEDAETREERKAAMERFADAHDELGSASPRAGWRFLSPTASLSAAARDCFGNAVPGNFSHGRHWFLLLGVPLLGFAVLARRVRAVEVVS